MLAGSISGPGIGTPVDLNSRVKCFGVTERLLPQGPRLKNVVGSNSTNVFKSCPYLIALPLLKLLAVDT